MAAPAAAPRPSVPTPRRSWFALARARHRSVLRRGTDRWRTTLVELELLAVVAAVALCALLGMSVFQQGRAHALQQAEHLYPAQAKVVGQPYPSGVGGELAQVSWTASNSPVHSGVAGVASTDRNGDRVQIWLDASGNLATAPATVQDTVGSAVLIGVLAMIGAGVVIVSAAAFARSRLDRRDEKAWETEWQVYEPLWSRRR